MLTTSSNSAPALPAAVLNFERNGLQLGRDIEDLQALGREQRTPAVLFYCARILDALCAEANVRLFGKATPGLVSNLRRLEDLRILPEQLSHELWALSRLALDNRLARRPTHWADACCGLIVLSRLLEWYFVQFERGTRLPTLGNPDAFLGTPQDTELREALDAIAKVETVVAWREVSERYVGALLRTPVLAGLCAERAFSLPRLPKQELQDFMARALNSFPGEVHLRRLLARSQVRSGETDAALEALLALDQEYPDETETLRLLGDEYRRRWSEARAEDSEEPLRQALHAYQRAFSGSRETDLHSGAQAAVLGLLRGRFQRAEAIALTLVEIYERRFRAMGTAFRFHSPEDRLILAHCALILGETEYARRRYLEVLAPKSEDKHNGRAVFPQKQRARLKRELNAMLIALGLPITATRFLEGVGSRPKKANQRQLMLPLIDPAQPH